MASFILELGAVLLALVWLCREPGWEPTGVFVGLLGAFFYHQGWVRSAKADSQAVEIRQQSEQLSRSNDEKNRLSLERQQTELELRNLRSLVHDLEKERLFDLITGIPNQEKLKLDIQKFTSNASEPGRFQLVLIDIDNFGEINKKYGYDKGDQVITHIARSIYNSTRRTDEVYKRSPETEDTTNPLISRAYRSYKGGDEFVFIFRGPQFEAVGFLNRLAEVLERAGDATVPLLSTRFDITFHGAIIQMYRGDTYNQAMTRLYNAFSLAAEGKNNLKLYWNPKEELAEQNFPDEKKRLMALKLYDTARTKFMLNPGDTESSLDA